MMNDEPRATEMTPEQLKEWLGDTPRITGEELDEAAKARDDLWKGYLAD